MSMMALRRNPHRKCKKEDVASPATQNRAEGWSEGLVEKKLEQREPITAPQSGQ